MNPKEHKPTQKKTPRTPGSASIPLSSQRLRQARLRCRLTIEEASRLTGANKMTLLRYESGDIHTIAPERLRRLAELYKVTPAWLAGVAPCQEFFSDCGQLLLSPDRAETPSHLGFRLLACLRFCSGEAQSSPYSAG